MGEPKEKTTKPAITEAAIKKANELVDKFRKFFTSDIPHSVNIPFHKMLETSRAKDCAIIACQLKLDGIYPWEHNHVLYTEVIKQINNLKDN